MIVIAATGAAVALGTLPALAAPAHSNLTLDQACAAIKPALHNQALKSWLDANYPGAFDKLKNVYKQYCTGNGNN
jgi:hypothetical protein